MKLPSIPQLSLYKHRYLLGYGLYGVLLLALLTLHVTDVPRGLSASEIASATHSATVSVPKLLFEDPLNAPYVLLQKASIGTFGLTTLAIRLPSIILAFITGITLVLMLRQWFRDNIAVLTGIVVATAGPFMSMGRSGSALIMHAFWLGIILYAATKKLSGGDKSFGWKIIFFVSAALSLYTPMMIYPLIAIAVSGLLHPHIRYALRRIPPVRLALVAGGSLLSLVPLILSAIRNPQIIADLLGLPSAATSFSEVGSNIMTVGRILLDFANPTINTFVLPLFSAAVIAVVILGVARTVVDRHSARSYMLLLWMGLIIVVTVLNPAAITILYMPMILFLAVGIEVLIREWYSLFPRNPYARIAGLIPIAILLVSISASNVSRYFYGYLYSDDQQTTSHELESIRNNMSLPALKDKPVAIISLPENSAFFEILGREYDTLSVTDKPDGTVAQIVTDTRYKQLSASEKASLGQPYRFVTSGKYAEPLVLRVYVSE